MLLCLLTDVYQEKWKMGFPSAGWNLNWPAEGSLTQANLQRFHFCGEELSVTGAVFPGSATSLGPVTGSCRQVLLPVLSLLFLLIPISYHMRQLSTQVCLGPK